MTDFPESREQRLKPDPEFNKRSDKFFEDAKNGLVNVDYHGIDKPAESFANVLKNSEYEEKYRNWHCESGRQLQLFTTLSSFQKQYIQGLNKHRKDIRHHQNASKLTKLYRAFHNHTIIRSNLSDSKKPRNILYSGYGLSFNAQAGAGISEGIGVMGSVPTGRDMFFHYFSRSTLGFNLDLSMAIEWITLLHLPEDGQVHEEEEYGYSWTMHPGVGHTHYGVTIVLNKKTHFLTGMSVHAGVGIQAGTGVSYFEGIGKAFPIPS